MEVLESLSVQTASFTAEMTEFWRLVGRVVWYIEGCTSRLPESFEDSFVFLSRRIENWFFEKANPIEHSQK